MTKYKNTDVRTGFKLGEIIEIELEELNKVPFNSKLEKVDGSKKVAKKKKKSSKQPVVGDLDGDGDFDKDDKSIAAKILRKKVK